MQRLWLLALLVFVPLSAARPGLEQPSPCDVVSPAECGAYREAVLRVPAPNGVPALGYAGRGFFGHGPPTGAVQVFSYERFGPFGLPAGWVCARWRPGTPRQPEFGTCPPNTGAFTLP